MSSTRHDEYYDFLSRWGSIKNVQCSQIDGFSKKSSLTCALYNTKACLSKWQRQIFLCTEGDLKESKKKIPGFLSGIIISISVFQLRISVTENLLEFFAMGYVLQEIRVGNTDDLQNNLCLQRKVLQYCLLFYNTPQGATFWAKVNCDAIGASHSAKDVTHVKNSSK